MEEACYTGLWVLVLLISCHGDEGALQKKWTFIGVELKSFEQICIWRNGPLSSRTLTTLHTAFSSRSQFLPGTMTSTAYSFSLPFFSCLPLSDETLLEVLIQKVTKEPELCSSIVAFDKDILRTAALGSLLFLISFYLLLLPDSCNCLSLLTTWNQHDIQMYSSCNSCFASDVSPMSHYIIGK